MTSKALPVKTIDLTVRRGRRLGQERRPFWTEIHLGADRPGRRRSGHPVETVAAQDLVNLEGSPAGRE